MRKRKNHLQNVPGAAPGIEHEEIACLPGGTGKVWVSCIDYSPSQIAVQDIHDIDEFVSKHRPEWSAVRWINVDGFSDMHVIHALAKKYDLHPLAIEDTLHKTQRPKVESFGGEESELLARLFIVTHAIEIEDDRLRQEQVSIFLGHKTILTFQEISSEEWDPIRQRIKAKGSRLRNSDASFLAYSLLDASVDSFFPIIESYSERAEELDNLILEQSNPALISEIHQLKRNLLTLRGVVWPMREVVASLQREEHECISDTTRLYLRDLYDHVIQLIDLVETYREITNNLTETYMSSTSNRMNEVMKVLTVINTIFIPLTFLAGVYGMNFHHFPELDQVWAYPAFWLICVAAVSGMLVYFRRRRWL